MVIIKHGNYKTRHKTWCKTWYNMMSWYNMVYIIHQKGTNYIE